MIGGSKMRTCDVCQKTLGSIYKFDTQMVIFARNAIRKQVIISQKLL